jgi:hypothetical protein
MEAFIGGWERRGSGKKGEVDAWKVIGIAKHQSVLEGEDARRASEVNERLKVMVVEEKEVLL